MSSANQDFSSLAFLEMTNLLIINIFILPDILIYLIKTDVAFIPKSRKLCNLQIYAGNQRNKVPLQTLADYKKYIITIIYEYKNTGNNEKKRLKYK